MRYLLFLSLVILIEIIHESADRTKVAIETDEARAHDSWFCRLLLLLFLGCCTRRFNWLRLQAKALRDIYSEADLLLAELVLPDVVADKVDSLDLM